VELPKAPDKLAGKLVTRAHLDAFTAEAEASGLSYLADVARVTYGLALRRGEVCAMRADWVDLDARTVTIRQGRGFQTKAGRDVTKPIPADAFAVLVRRLKIMGSADAFVFTNTRGEPLQGPSLSRTFKRVARRGGLPETVCFHGLRHGGISRAVAGGASLEAARLFAGHSEVAQTARYTHLSPECYAGQVLTAFDGKRKGGAISRRNDRRQSKGKVRRRTRRVSA
jgi:integrase